MLQKLSITSGCVVLVLGMASAQRNSQPQSEYKIPPAAASQQNPVKPTSESLSKGKKLYGYDCAVCHGKNGDGKGEMSDIKGITDFTDPATLKGRPDGELFYVIKNGKGDMPTEGDRAKPDDIWNMVNYVRSLAKK
jgi:mono/diheme cytochrome c family protein